MRVKPAMTLWNMGDDMSAVMIAIAAATAEEEQKKRRLGMTDIQFKAMVKMCLTMAEATGEIKDFKKAVRLAGGLSGAGFEVSFTTMLCNMADSVSDMAKVRQVLLDIMMMEGGN